MAVVVHRQVSGICHQAVILCGWQGVSSRVPRAWVMAAVCCPASPQLQH